MNWGSGDSLKCSTWCGLSPNARQIRLMADWDIPVAAAIDRVDRCVALSGLGLQRGHDDPLNVFVADRAGLARSGLVVKAIEPALSKTHPPLAHRGVSATQPGGDVDAALPLSSGQHDPCPQRQRLGRLGSARPALEHLPLLIGEHDLGPLGHGLLPSSSLTRKFATTYTDSYELLTQVTRACRGRPA